MVNMKMSEYLYNYYFLPTSAKYSNHSVVCKYLFMNINYIDTVNLVKENRKAHPSRLRRGEKKLPLSNLKFF